MAMYATVCKATDNGDSQIAEFIIAGFLGQLRGWWDNVLTEAQRNEIPSAVKIAQIVVSLKDEQGRDIIQQQPTLVESVLYTLISSIVLAFIGPHPETLDRSKNLLLNLRCHTLTHFR